MPGLASGDSVWTPLRICRLQQMSSDNGQQDCVYVCDLSVTELNEFDFKAVMMHLAWFYTKIFY